MALLDEQFDATQQESTQDKFTLIPVGTEAPMQVLNSEMKTTNDFAGKYIHLDILVLDGPFANRRIFQNITWKNQSEKAEQIGRGQFGDLCRACNVLAPSDTAELHNLPFIGKVGIEKGAGGYQDKNKVVAFFAIDPETGEKRQADKPAPAQAAAPAKPAAPAPSPQKQQATAPARPLAPTATGKPAWMQARSGTAAAPS